MRSSSFSETVVEVSVLPIRNQAAERYVEEEL